MWRCVSAGTLLSYILTVLVACDSQPDGMPRSRQWEARTQVILLGTGTPNADPERCGSAIAIVVDSVAYLVDAGPGLVRRAAAAHQVGIKGLAVSNLERIFITHLHSDHTLGYADLIFTPWVLEREAPLQAYGPAGLEAMTEHLLAAYAEDIDIRLHDIQPATPKGYKVEVHEIVPGPIYEDERIKVLAFEVHHGKWPVALGYRFQTPDGVIVISGDTRYCENLIEHSRGADILIHEVYSEAGFKRHEPEWQRYHAQYHTSSSELARIANQVQPKRLILYHQLFWGTSDVQLVMEVQQGYDGMVISGRDLDVFTLPL